MKNLLFLFVALCFLACSGASDPTSYTLVKIMKDGSQQKEQFNAESDSAAMIHLVEVGFADQGKTIEKGILLNYKGDTVNTKENASKMMEKTIGISNEQLEKDIEEMDSVVKMLEEME